MDRSDSLLRFFGGVDHRHHDVVRSDIEDLLQQDGVVPRDAHEGKGRRGFEDAQLVKAGRKRARCVFAIEHHPVEACLRQRLDDIRTARRSPNSKRGLYGGVRGFFLRQMLAKGGRGRRHGACSYKKVSRKRLFANTSLARIKGGDGPSSRLGDFGLVGSLSCRCPREIEKLFAFSAFRTSMKRCLLPSPRHRHRHRPRLQTRAERKTPVRKLRGQKTLGAVCLERKCPNTPTKPPSKPSNADSKNCRPSSSPAKQEPYSDGSPKQVKGRVSSCKEAIAPNRSLNTPPKAFETF